jgi:hypothetical protein
MEIKNGYVGVVTEWTDGKSTYSSSVDIVIDDRGWETTFTLWPLSDRDYEINEGRPTVLFPKIVEIQKTWDAYMGRIDKEIHDLTNH